MYDVKLVVNDEVFEWDIQLLLHVHHEVSKLQHIRYVALITTS